MKNNEEIYNFLKSRGFELLQKDTSAFFGDYFDVFSNATFELRFSSSKSFETIDIRRSEPNEGWYDLALVKALFYKEKSLCDVTTFEEHKEFLLREFDRIADIFSVRDYKATKARLEELGDERARQLFPET